jgi:hypothetical protein
VIGGISSQVGFTEEKPDLQALRPREDKGFDRVLQRAAEGRRRNLEASTTASEPRHVARRRALFEEREAEPKRTDADPSAQGDGSRVAPQEPQETDTAKAPSAQGRENVQSRAPSEPPSEEEQAAVAADGRVLEDAFIDPDQAARAAQATHLSGLGLVSYQLSPHGKGEAELAAQAGLTPQAQGQRIASAQLDVAAQGIESGEVLKKAAPEEVLPGKTPRQQFPDLVEVAKPEDLSESELDQLAAKAESKSDAGRLALLNSMRQPPPGKTEAMASAFGLESGAGLKNGKVKGEGGEQGRTLFQVMPRGAEAAQTQSTVPNLTAPDRSTFGALQQPDDAQRPLMERVTQEVRWMIRNDRSEATIRLEPDHLGTMRIKVVQQDGALRVDMTVDNQLARNLIESRLSDLQQRLQEQNTGAEQFSFNVNVQDNGGWESFRQAPHTARTMPYIPVTPEGESAHVAMTAGVSKPVWGQQGVGIYA